jgi:alpha-beta hydrolase superfamily lysophospholipase
MNGTAPLLPFEAAFKRWLASEGMGWERITFELPGGGRTAGYRLDPAAQPRKILLAVHGAGNDALFAWIGLFKRLLSRGYSIVTFDLPGHGRENRTLFSAESALAAVEAALAECLRGSRESIPVEAVGISLGGSILLRSLPRLQDRLTAAVAVVAPLRINLSFRSLLPEMGPRNLRVVLREWEHYGPGGLVPSFGPFKRDIYPLRLADRPPPGPFGYVRTLNDALAAMNLVEEGASITIPVLLLYGEADRIVPISQGERLAAAIPPSQLHRTRGGTHLSTPLDPSAIDLMVEWLEHH